MPRETICVYCEKPIVGRCSRAKFCSKSCREKAWHAAHPGWRQAFNRKHKERYRRSAAAYHVKHRERLLAGNKAWRAANPEKVRAASEKHGFKLYGMTRADYDRMLAAQDGRCACCGSMASGRKRWGRLTIDHDHETGAVRALLCAPCNAIAGQAGDNPARLRAVARYLEEHGVVVQVVMLAG